MGGFYNSIIKVCVHSGPRYFIDVLTNTIKYFLLQLLYQEFYTSQPTRPLLYPSRTMHWAAINNYTDGSVVHNSLIPEITPLFNKIKLIIIYI